MTTIMYKMKFHYAALLCIILISTLSSCSDQYTEITDEKLILKDSKITLGEKLFFETKLSNPEGQSCANCHAPQTGFSDPNHQIVSNGINGNLFSNRNAPSLSYNVFSPERYYNLVDQTFIGGLFIDGRSQNLETQAINPLLNPVEMNNLNINMIVQKIKSLSYYSDFIKIYGTNTSDTELLNQFTNAISNFEKSTKVNSFTSKFDYFSKQLVSFSNDELAGLALYKGKANCAACHPLDPDENSGKVLLTDFSYDNIGVPKNLNNPFYSMPASINPDGANYIDYGIGAIVNMPEHNGKFKVPTLRNIAISAPYFHNGFYNTLSQVIHFYNKRKVENLGQPEIPETVNTQELGDLKMTIQEEQQLEKFLLTLTDHYRQ